jgi:hypothetical protein
MFTESSIVRAAAGDTDAALACQWVGDVHRVMCALWVQAGARADPHTGFFTLAEKALVAAEVVATEDHSPARVLLAGLRGAFAMACGALNVPLVFPAAPHLDTLTGVVDLAGARDRLLDGLSAREFVENRLAAARTVTGVDALHLAIDAYLVDVADRAGDELMLTAVARMAVLQDAAPRGGTDLGSLAVAAKNVLGKVEWIRAQQHLREAVVRL